MAYNEYGMDGINLLLQSSTSDTSSLQVGQSRIVKTVDEIRAKLEREKYRLRKHEAEHLVRSTASKLEVTTDVSSLFDGVSFGLGELTVKQFICFGWNHLAENWCFYTTKFSASLFNQARPPLPSRMVCLTQNGATSFQKQQYLRSDV